MVQGRLASGYQIADGITKHLCFAPLDGHEMDNTIGGTVKGMMLMDTKYRAPRPSKIRAKERANQVTVRRERDGDNCQ